MLFVDHPPSSRSRRISVFAKATTRQALPVLAAVLLFATPALAGPPLICHPFEVESGKLIAWGEVLVGLGFPRQIRTVLKPFSL